MRGRLDIIHKLGMIEFVWEGCERVWGGEWDQEDVVEILLLSGVLVAGCRDADSQVVAVAVHCRGTTEENQISPSTKLVVKLDSNSRLSLPPLMHGLETIVR